MAPLFSLMAAGISESIEVNVRQKGLGLVQGGMIVSAVVGYTGSYLQVRNKEPG